MTRKIKIGTQQCEVSKNETKEVQRLMLFSGVQRQANFDGWLNAAPTPEARARRLNVGRALKLNVPAV